MSFVAWASPQPPTTASTAGRNLKRDPWFVSRDPWRKNPSQRLRDPFLVGLSMLTLPTPPGCFGQGVRKRIKRKLVNP